MARAEIARLQEVQQIIKPQYAIERLYELTKDRDTYITTEVGQHQMWAAQFYGFEEPNRWMTSGGLGTMGYGLPAAIGVQMAHPQSLVIDIAGEASVLMNMQEMSTAVQYQLPVKIFILNNQYMGMVRQWQELLHGGRYAESYTDSLPDFVKLAEAYHAVGIRCEKPGDLDGAIQEMIDVNKPVIFDCVVDQNENCFPMIPSGRAHNEMLLGRRRRKRRRGSDRRRQDAGVIMSNGSTSHYPAAPAAEKIETHTLSVIVDNEPGVLARVIGLFSGRGYNIDSLTVSETEHQKHLSRITIVTRGTPMVIEQIKNQLDRLVPIHRVVDMTSAGPVDPARARHGQGARHRRAAGRGAAPCRRLPRPRDRRRHRELRVRDHRRQRQDRAVHRADAAARPGRGVAHRHRRDRARRRRRCEAGQAGSPWIYIVYPRGDAMKVKVAQWGNSLGLRLPKAAAEAAGLMPGSEVDVTVEGRELRVRQPLPYKHYRLEDLAGARWSALGRKMSRKRSTGDTLVGRRSSTMHIPDGEITLDDLKNGKLKKNAS